MSGAKVLDLDELARFRAAVIRALDEMRLVIGEAESEIGRVRSWVERDQALYWQGQKRKAQEAVAVCRSALYRKQMVTSSKDQKPSVVDEKKALDRAVARLALCERKIAAIRRWSTVLAREEILFRAGMAPLSAQVGRDLPHAIALLTKVMDHLHAYVSLEAPDLVTLLGRERTEGLVADMRRRGDGGKEAGAGEGAAGRTAAGTDAGRGAEEAADAPGAVDGDDPTGASEGGPR